MTGQVFTVVRRLSEVIKEMQKCLQCTICLYTITDPVKTVCGHRFCRTCIQAVLQNKNASCPLCKLAIQRRTVSADEDMQKYIERMERLIDAVQADSGIDISCQLERSRSMKDNDSTNTTDFSYDPEKYNRPSCSKDNLPLRQPGPRTFSNVNKKKRSSKESLNKKRESGNSDIMKFLCKYSLSGVEPLPVDTMTDYQDDIEDDVKMNSKVHNWLNALPDSEALDDPDKITPEQPAECNLDDTLTISVTQNCKDNKLDDYEAEDKQQRRSPLKTSNRDNENGGRGPSEARSDSSKTELLSDRGEPRPSTSGLVKSSEDKGRSQERSNEVQRTSPCDLLPSMKNNWSSVVRFGKELRPKKKKKLKSLNVSKCRSHDETVAEGTSKLKWSKDEGRGKEPSVSSGVSKAAKVLPGIKDACARRKSAENQEEGGRRRDKDPEASVASVSNIDKSLSKVDDRRKSTENRIGDAETRPSLDNGRSNAEEKSAQRLESSDEVQVAGESSFIVLDEGRQVYIRNLNSDQMNNIIGVETEENRQTENALPLKKRRNLSSTPPHDRSEPPFHSTPTKLSVDKPPWEATGESVSKCQSAISQTSIRGRLSLTRRATDPKSNDSSAPDCAARLSMARRDLNRQIDETLHDSAAKTAPETRNKTAKDDRAKDKRTETTKANNRSVVTFKKLGKIFKIRKKHVRFLYLGSTRRKAMLSGGYLSSKPERPFNLVDYFDTQCFQNYGTSSNTFGNNLRITVNDSLTGNELENFEPKAEPSMTNVSDQSIKCVEVTEQSGPKEPVQPSTSAVGEPADSVDVVFVSLNEKDQKTQSDEPKEPGSTKASTESKDTVKLMSPANDSQLKYLSLESPTVARTSRLELPLDTDLSSQKKDSSFEVKGEHSRALTRKSQQALGSSDLDSIGQLARKRKNPESPDDKQHKTRRTSSDEESNHSFSSQVTCIRGSENELQEKVDDKVLSSKTRTKCIDTVSLSSGSDIVDFEDALGKQKKTYRRVIPLTSSDTDSPNLACLNDFKDPEESPSAKRKRTTSQDSDCEIELESLTRGWCEELDVSGRRKKRSKLDQSGSSSKTTDDRGSRVSPGPPMVRIHGSQPRHLSEFASRLAAEQWDEVVPVDQDSPDFGATIDKIQHIRNAASASGDVKKETTVLENLNDLNFDSNAFDDYFKECEPPSKQVGLVLIGSPQQIRNVRSLNRDVMLDYRSSSSDKENKYEGKRTLGASDSEDDATMMPYNCNLTKKRNDRTQERLKPRESNEADEERGDGAQVKDELVTKDTDFEQDSLMNITQHYLLIKQFEEDLFGKPLVSNSSFGLKGQEQRTPQKGKNKDTEHSAEEDDIVENTPEAKTKSLQLNNSIREAAGVSPIRGIAKKLPRTPSTSSGGSTVAGSPYSKRSLHPLYQSTPKVQQPPKNRHASAIKPSSLNIESSIRRTKSLMATTSNNPEQRLCFVCSGLLVAQVEQVKRLAQMVNARYLTQFEEQVTHVIVKVDKESNGANKTLKYLQGIAHRKWIVGFQWVLDSLREKKLVNEERYEAVDHGTLEPGPRNSRLRTKNLFEGFFFLCIGPYIDVSVEQYQDLLRATGATVVDSLDALIAEKRKLKIIVIQSDVHDYEIIVEWYRKARAVPIVHDWVVECISQYKLISFYPYLQELSRQDVLALGYPDFLVEDVPEGDSDSACNTTI